MGKAIGMVEFQTVSAGMNGADTMIKTAEVEVVECATVCPGKYIVIISGELSAVKASVDAAKAKFTSKVIDLIPASSPSSESKTVSVKPFLSAHLEYIR